MNRRGFIARLASGIAGGLLATHLPPSTLSLVPPGLQQECAIAYLTQVWNAFFRGQGQKVRGSFDIYVGESLLQQFMAEIVTIDRFVPYGVSRQPKFGVYKTARLIPDGPGWHHRFVRRESQS